MHWLKAEKEKRKTVHRVELDSIEYPSIIGVCFDSDKASIDINPNSTIPNPIFFLFVFVDLSSWKIFS